MIRLSQCSKLNLLSKQHRSFQRVEAFWGQLVRYSDEQWFRDELRQLEADSLFVRKDEIDKYVKASYLFL